VNPRFALRVLVLMVLESSSSQTGWEAVDYLSFSMGTIEFRSLMAD